MGDGKDREEKDLNNYRRQEMAQAMRRYYLKRIRREQVLSRLSRAQIKKLSSYSPAKQRQIFERIEERLERRMEDPLKRDVPSLQQRHRKSLPFQEEEREETRKIRAHPYPGKMQKSLAAKAQGQKRIVTSLDGHGTLKRDQDPKRGAGQLQTNLAIKGEKSMATRPVGPGNGNPMPGHARPPLIRGTSFELAPYLNRTDTDASSEEAGRAYSWEDQNLKRIHLKKLKDARRASFIERAGIQDGEADRQEALQGCKRQMRDAVSAQEGRSLTRADPLTEKSSFYPSKVSSPAFLSQGIKRARSRKEKRREEKLSKAYLSALISVLEKDISRDQKIRQAQRSGQVQMSISDLTERSMGSSIRSAALPLRVQLQITSARFRREAKKRMMMALKSLVLHAAAFGAPLLLLLVIFMLLAGILTTTGTQEIRKGSGLGYQIVTEAKKHIGLPYVYGGRSLTEGCDCSGFVWAIYHLFGYDLPRTAGEQYQAGRKVGKDVDDWQLGDLIYYSKSGSIQSGGGRAEHIVIYIGGGQVISCGPVEIYPWDYRSDYYGTCRIIPDETDGDFSGSSNEQICFNYFLSQGFSRAAAAGILGNMYVESAATFDPSIHQFGGGPGRGICQWEASSAGGSGRFDTLVSFARGKNKSWDDLRVQLQFVTYELNSGAMNIYFAKFGGVEAFKNMTDPAAAAYVFLCGYEYCGDPGKAFLESNFALSIRSDHARWAYQTYQ